MRFCYSILLLLGLFLLQGFTVHKTGDNPYLRYQIRFRGMTSGKEKVLTAGPNDLFSLWKNVEDSLKGFAADEQIALEMHFFKTDAILKDTLPLSKIRKFPKTHLELLSNCETFSYDVPEWTSPFYNQTVVVAEIDTRHNAPQGKGCLKMEGTDENEDGYICSLTRHFRNEYIDNSSVMPSFSAKADNTWIFFYAYGEGSPDDVVSLLVSELDIVAENDKTKDFYAYSIPMDFYGWKQIAIRYSDLKPTVPFFANDARQKFGQEGDKIQDPKKLAAIQFTLATKSKGSKATCYLDNMMIVYN